MNLRQAAEQALECLEYHWDNSDSDLEDTPYVLEAKQALRQALAQPNHFRDAAKKPVGYVTNSGTAAYLHRGVHLEDDTPLYVAPPKEEWVGLTDAQVEEIAKYHGIDGLYETSRIDFYRAIEITLKEKNCDSKIHAPTRNVSRNRY